MEAPTRHCSSLEASTSYQQQNCDFKLQTISVQQDHHRSSRAKHSLLLLALLLAGAFQQAAADAFDRSRCPSWLSQYEQWHSENRSKPGAKYLIADAPGFVGIGDHLRGFMYALRAAEATNRVLLLHWEHPGNLTDFLVPGSRLDWRWQGTPATALSAADKTLKGSDDSKDVFGNSELRKAFPNATFFTHDPSDKTFLVLRTNFPAEQKCMTCPAVLGKPHEGYDYVCMFRFLFKASTLVEQMTDEHLRSLYPHHHVPSSDPASGSSGASTSSDSCIATSCKTTSSSSSSTSSSTSSSSSIGSNAELLQRSNGGWFEYQAVHLRLGVMRGEEGVTNRMSDHVDPLEKFLLAVSCGDGMAAKAGMNTTETQLLLLADHRAIRRFSRHGKLTNVVSPAYDAVHTKVNSAEAHLLSFVDLNLIARAKCAVLSHSGFSNAAWWLSGGNSCRLTLSECHKICASDSTQPYCP